MRSFFVALLLAFIFATLASSLPVDSAIQARDVDIEIRDDISSLPERRGEDDDDQGEDGDDDDQGEDFATPPWKRANPPKPPNPKTNGCKPACWKRDTTPPKPKPKPKPKANKPPSWKRASTPLPKPKPAKNAPVW